MKNKKWLLVALVVGATSVATLGVSSSAKPDLKVLEAESTVKQFASLAADYINEGLPRQYVQVKFTEMSDVMYQNRSTRELGSLMIQANDFVDAGDDDKLIQFLKTDFREAVEKSPLDMEKYYQ